MLLSFDIKLSYPVEYPSGMEGTKARLERKKEWEASQWGQHMATTLRSSMRKHKTFCGGQIRGSQLGTCLLLSYLLTG